MDNGFMNRVGKHHVNMAGFLEVIQKEQSMSEIVMNQLKSGRADVIPKKRRKYAQYDKRLKNIVELHDRDDVIEYLCNVSNIVVI